MSAVLAESAGPREAVASASLLEATGLGRRFRGLAAVDAVSIDVCVGEIHAVIGTNGAGKSTLINMLSGELAPSAGTVRFAGHDVTRWSQPRRARAGLGRSYQRTTIFAEFSVLENCRLAAQAGDQRPWLVWERAAGDQRGIAARGDRPRPSLSRSRRGRQRVDRHLRRRDPRRHRHQRRRQVDSHPHAVGRARAERGGGPLRRP